MPKQLAKAHTCQHCQDCILNIHLTDFTAKVNLRIWRDVVAPDISEELTKFPSLEKHLLSQLENLVFFCHTTSSEIDDYAANGCALFQYIRDRTAPTMRRLAKGEGESIEKMDYCKSFNRRLRWRGEPQAPEQEKILVMIEPHREEESSTFCFRWFASPYRPFHVLHFEAPKSRKGYHISDDWVDIDPFQMMVGPETGFGNHIPRSISSIPDFPPMLASIKAKIQQVVKEEVSGLVAKNNNQCRFMPSRLLEIVKGASGPLDKVRLVEVNSPEEGIFYAALSYCWGGPQEVKLTKKDKPLLTEGPSLDLLPQTLKDAVSITSRLDLSYLWIDALCIIQDDAEDMNHELAVMSQIYEHAAVTIAASRAQSVHEGFLHERLPFRDSSETCFFLPCIQPVKKIGDKYGEIELESVKVFPVADLEGYHGPEPLEKSDGIPTNPLEHRAWALQERTLSPRVLDFGELCTHFSVMDIANRTVTPSADGWKGVTLSERNLPLFSAESTTNHDMALVEWAAILSQYTSLRLSFLSDRLPGVSAFATFLSPALGGAGEYLAGIWKSELPTSLLWTTHALDRKTVDNLSDSPARPGPSWSWASIPHQVSYRFEGREDRVQADQDAIVIGSHVELQSSKVKFGAVKQGQLRMRGRLRPVRLCLERPADFGFEMYDKARSEARTSVKRIVIGPEQWAEHRGLHRRNYDNPNPHHRDLKLAASVWRDYNDDVTDEIIGDSSELFALPVGSRSSQSTGDQVTDAHASGDISRLRRRLGLILLRQNADVYTRVAVFETLDFDSEELRESWALEPEEAPMWFREQYDWFGKGELQEFTII